MQRKIHRAVCLDYAQQLTLTGWNSILKAANDSHLYLDSSPELPLNGALLVELDPIRITL